MQIFNHHLLSNCVSFAKVTCPVYFDMLPIQMIPRHGYVTLKAPYSSKIDIFIQKRFYKLIYSINTIIKYGIWQPVKFQLVSHFWTGSNWNDFFYCISELMLATLIQRYNKKKIISFKNERLIELLQAVRCHILWLYLYKYINLSHSSLNSQHSAWNISRCRWSTCM